jgi:choline dehydrogenase-like flavoprotein
VIEAGGRDRSPNIKIPAAFPNQFHTKLDWEFTTEPEPHVDNRQQCIPRGKSLGGSKVWLRSADPTDKPRIITNTLGPPDDLASMLAGMRLAREIANQSPLKETIVKELKPGSEAVDDEDLAADLRQRLMLIYHPVGTGRMSDTDENAVVDSQLRVHAVEACASPTPRSCRPSRPATPTRQPS